MRACENCTKHIKCGLRLEKNYQTWDNKNVRNEEYKNIEASVFCRGHC